MNQPTRGQAPRFRILLVDEEFPFPLNSGKRLRSYNLVRNLARVCDITYLAYGEPDSEGVRQFQADNLNPIPVRPPNRGQSGPRFYWRLFANLFSPEPYIVTSHYTRRLQDRLYAEVESGAHDIVMCEWTPYTRFVRDLEGVRKIVNTHNIEAAIWRRYEEQEKNLLRRLYISLQRAKVEAFEAKCFHWLNGATAVSEEEARVIRDFAVPYPVAVIENGVDPDYFTCRGTSRPGNIVFTGSMDWRPNQDAVLFFAEQILPLVRARRPDTTFTVVGRSPSRRVLDLVKVPGVTVTGTVDDVCPYLAAASVLVVPLRIGGGSRLKILEGMSMERAVVSTTVGAEGLRVTNNSDILIADTPDTFADAVVRCLDDPALCARLGRAGRQLIEQEYQWKIIARRMHEYLCRVLNTK